MRYALGEVYGANSIEDAIATGKAEAEKAAIKTQLYTDPQIIGPNAYVAPPIVKAEVYAEPLVKKAVLPTTIIEKKEPIPLPTVKAELLSPGVVKLPPVVAKPLVPEKEIMELPRVAAKPLIDILPTTTVPLDRPAKPTCDPGKEAVFNIGTRLWECSPSWRPVTETGAPGVTEQVYAPPIEIPAITAEIPGVTEPSGFLGVPIWAWALGAVAVVGGYFYFRK
jgi:hypothetical protein